MKKNSEFGYYFFSLFLILLLVESSFYLIWCVLWERISIISLFAIHSICTFASTGLSFVFMLEHKQKNNKIHWGFHVSFLLSYPAIHIWEIKIVRGIIDIWTQRFSFLSLFHPIPENDEEKTYPSLQSIVRGFYQFLFSVRVLPLESVYME
jgi:hypothetical protein